MMYPVILKYKEKQLNMYKIPMLPLPIELETVKVLRQLNSANKRLAELKGVALTIPNESILINTLSLQEAKESSAVENIITTHDDMYKADAELRSFAASASTKEVISYASALKQGFSLIRHNKVLTLNNIKCIQEVLEKNKAGFRKVPGTSLQNSQVKNIIKLNQKALLRSNTMIYKSIWITLRSISMTIRWKILIR